MSKFDYTEDKLFQESSFNFFWWLCMKNNPTKNKILSRLGRKPLKEWTRSDVEGLILGPADLSGDEGAVEKEEGEGKNMFFVNISREAVFAYVKAFLNGIYQEVEVLDSPNGITASIEVPGGVVSVTASWGEVDIRVPHPMNCAELISRRLDEAIIKSFKRGGDCGGEIGGAER